LVDLQLHKNEFFVRHARRLLQERAQREKPADEIVAKLTELCLKHSDVTRRLRGLWCLHAVGAIDEKFLVELTSATDENVRAWAIRLLREYDGGLEHQTKLLAKLAANDTSGLVRLEIASALQRLPLDDRWGIAEALASHAEDARDDNLPLMIWYGIEPAVAADKAQAAKLLTASKIPTVRQFIARRIAAK
jgi:hypothetical protein